MAFDAKPVNTYAEETHSSIEKDKTQLDLVPGADNAQKALYEEFASKDEEWRAHMDKKLLRKVDTRMLPCLVMLYLLNFLDRYSVTSDLHTSDEVADCMIVPIWPRPVWVA